MGLKPMLNAGDPVARRAESMGVQRITLRLFFEVIRPCVANFMALITVPDFQTRKRSKSKKLQS